jgi:hypothetical protein
VQQQGKSSQYSMKTAACRQTPEQAAVYQLFVKIFGSARIKGFSSLPQIHGK